MLTLFFSLHLNVVLCFQFGVDSKSIPTVVDDPLPFFVRKAFNLPDFTIVGVDVLKLDLKRWVFLDEQNGLNITLFKGFVVTDVEHSKHNQHCKNQ